MSLPPEEKNTVSPIQMAELLSSAAQAYWWTYNWQSDCFSCSDQLYNLLGLPRATRITYALLSAYVLHDDLGRIYQLIHTLPPSEKLHDIIRFTVQGKILWFENNVTYFPATQERGAYAVGLMHDVTWLCERQSQASPQSPELSMIADYLSRIADMGNISTIYANVQTSIGSIIDTVLVEFFFNRKGQFSSLHPLVPELQALNAADYLSYRAIHTGETILCPTEQHPHAAIRNILTAIEAKNIIFLPIKYQTMTLACLTVAFREDALTSAQHFFLTTLCAHLSLQLHDIFLHRELDEELHERIRVEECNLELQNAIKLEKLRTEFFGNFSHEFKTPINVILSTLELFKIKLSMEQYPMSDDYEKFLRYIRQNAFRLLRLSNNLIDVTKLEYGQIQPCLKPCDLNACLNELVSSVNQYALSRDLTLEYQCDLDPSSSLVVFDQEKMERAVLNLLSNAIKCTARGGHITVCLTRTKTEIQISVADTGFGIAPEALPLIFDKLHVSKTNLLTRPCEGSGLGLSIVKSLVELHRGRVWAESELGKGSVFHIAFPANLTPCAENATLSASFQPQKPGYTRAELEFSWLDCD